MIDDAERRRVTARFEHFDRLVVDPSVLVPELDAVHLVNGHPDPLVVRVIVVERMLAVLDLRRIEIDDAGDVDLQRHNVALGDPAVLCRHPQPAVLHVFDGQFFAVGDMTGDVIEDPQLGIVLDDENPVAGGELVRPVPRPVPLRAVRCRPVR